MMQEAFILRHYTRPELADIIFRTGILLPGMKGRVYVTDLELKPQDVLDKIIGGCPNREGKGDAYLEIEVLYEALYSFKQGRNQNEMYKIGSLRNKRNGIKIIGWKYNLN